MRKNFLYLLITCLIPCLNSCSPGQESKSESHSEALEMSPVGQNHFEDITQYTGITFRHTIGDDELSNLIESVGGGAAILDYNQDGDMDIYISNGSFSGNFSKGEKPKELPENALYKNLGNGRFENVTDQAKVADTGFGMGVTIGDYDNDGYPDIYLSNYGPNVLYHNDGNGSFTDVTAKTGVAGDACSVGAVWLDYDRDGLLDLYVGNYVEFDPKYDLYYLPDGFPGPMNFDGQPDVLYRNLGNGEFKDVTKEMGVYRKDGRAMVVGSADYDNDGFPDIYVANDHMVNYLFHNEGGRSFTESATRAGVAFNQAGEATTSMSVDFADYNGDGLMDLFVSDDSYSSLYQNQGSGVFTDLSYQAGIAIASGQHIGWTSAFFDFDHDMDPDIFKVNGEIQHLYGQEDQLFKNKGDGKFEDVSLEQGPYFQKEYVGRGGCFGDLDNDGDIDALIVNLNDHPVVLRNDVGNQKNWILISLIGSQSNRDGIGAKVKVRCGEKVQVSEKKNASGYLSQNDPRVHFGLGENESIDRIEVSWPSGIVQKLENVAVNQILVIEEE